MPVSQIPRSKLTGLAERPWFTERRGISLPFFCIPDETAAIQTFLNGSDSFYFLLPTPDIPHGPYPPYLDQSSSAVLPYT